MECTWRKRFVFILLELLSTLRAELSRFKNVSTSYLSEVFKTLYFCWVFDNLFNIRLSMLLRLFITFSCIWVVLNSLITLLTWKFFLSRSFYCMTSNFACCAFSFCFLIEVDLSFLALCSRDLWLRISLSRCWRPRLTSRWLSFLLSIIDCYTIDRLRRWPSLALKFSNL